MTRRAGPRRRESQSPRVRSPRQDAVLTAVTEWEARNARAQREREARALQEQEHEQLLTYTREDAYSAVRGVRAAGRCCRAGPFSVPVATAGGLTLGCRCLLPAGFSPSAVRATSPAQGRRLVACGCVSDRVALSLPLTRRSTSVKVPTGRWRSCR